MQLHVLLTQPAGVPRLGFLSERLNDYSSVN